MKKKSRKATLCTATCAELYYVKNAEPWGYFLLVPNFEAEIDLEDMEA